jgi:hypothetical protein
MPLMGVRLDRYREIGLGLQLLVSTNTTKKRFARRGQYTCNVMPIQLACARLHARGVVAVAALYEGRLLIQDVARASRPCQVMAKMAMPR